MLVLNDTFKEKIINRYQKDGIEWLNNFNTVVDKYKDMFNLSNIKILDNLSINIVIKAKSKDFGEVIMKIGAPGMTFLNEIKYINLLSLDNMVKCYYYNTDDRVMILENIYPGYNLTNVESFDERLKIFSMLINDICKNSNHLSEFLTYRDRLKDKISNITNLDGINSDLLEMLLVANDMYDEISSMNLPKYVLHNDLQHKNILKDGNGWKMIDPHGVVGEKVFDTCQFIKAELPSNSIEDIKFISKKVADSTGEDLDLIYKALYIENTTKILFYLKSKEDEEIISYNISLCKNLIKCLNSLNEVKKI